MNESSRVGMSTSNIAANASGATNSMGFLETVTDLLEDTQDIIKVQHTTAVEASALKELIRAMASKIHLQELEIERQREAIEAQQQEMRYLRTHMEETTSLRAELRRLAASTEELTAQQRIQGQRVDRVRQEMDDTQLDINKLLYGGGAAGGNASMRAAGGATPGGGQANPPVGVLHTPRTERPAPAGGHTPGGMVTPSHQDVAAFEIASAFRRPSQPAAQPQQAESPLPPVHRPMAGLEIIDTVGGVKVTAVKPEGPAEAAGLEVGDQVLRVNNKEMRVKTDFVKILSMCVVGQGIDISYKRDGFPTKTTRMFLGSAPQQQ